MHQPSGGPHREDHEDVAHRPDYGERGAWRAVRPRISRALMHRTTRRLGRPTTFSRESDARQNVTFI